MDQFDEAVKDARLEELVYDFQEWRGCGNYIAEDERSLESDKIFKPTSKPSHIPIHSHSYEDNLTLVCTPWGVACSCRGPKSRSSLLSLRSTLLSTSQHIGRKVCNTRIELGWLSKKGVLPHNARAEACSLASSPIPSRRRGILDHQSMLL